MNIKPFNNQISFSRIDNSVEAFVTPPNDSLVGLLMGKPKDKVEISGHIGEKNFNYTYSIKNNEISMDGEYDGLPFHSKGNLSDEVNLNGTIGENAVSSNIAPQVQGPLNTGKAGTVEVNEKLDFNPSSGGFNITGKIGEDILDETIQSEGAAITDRGTIGNMEIDRTAVRDGKGFKINGTIGGLDFEEFIKM